MNQTGLVSDFSLPQNARRGNYVMLRADGLRLLVPQQEVGVVRYLDNKPAATGDPGIFTMLSGDTQHPVIALSAEMKPLNEFPLDRIMVCSLNGTDAEFLWAWSEIKVMLDLPLQPQAIPAIMCTTGTPVTEFADLAGTLAFICSGPRIAEFAFTQITAP